MKTLVSISFAIDLDEDELVGFVRKIDQSIFKGISEQLSAGLPEGVTWEEVEELMDWYGATFTPRRDLAEFVGGDVT